jgi:hypothetical protein
VLIAALLALAVVAGAAGTWSPCGLSAIETIRDPSRYVRSSCAAFACGALAGGAATFTVLSVLGAIVPSSRLAATVLVALAALAEACGLAIRPQIRRQVPEHWRRTMPLPVAVLLYGVLLGSGFATFVYTFAVWALAAIAFVLGSPRTGAIVGIAFGLGRALPVVLLVQARRGRELVDAMAQRPGALLLVRRCAAAALVVVAAVSAAGGAAAATSLGVGRDPSAAGDVVVWTGPSGGVARHEGSSETTSVPGLAVVGGSLLAWRVSSTVHVVRLADTTPVLDLDVPGISALAVSDEWLVARAQSPDGATVLSARAFADPANVRIVATARPPLQLGRPVLDGNLLVYHLAGRRSSSIVAADLAAGTRRVVRRSTSALLTNPALLGGRLVYDRQTSRAQLLELGPLDRRGADRAVYKLGAPTVHDTGHEHGYSHRTRSTPPRPSKWRLWTTALSTQHAYVTLLPRIGSPAAARLVSVSR